MRTAVSPSFEDIGRLAAIAAARTALNYFLDKEIAEEQARVGAAGPVTTSPWHGTPRRRPPDGADLRPAAG
ncbi:DUF1622 domain-containing protein [Saccharothrix yanglingensis]|uniref:DUF1622 domain-containing protein n=1 Tax=Saccharothrix yanglingensis TaxID=659496 RepID=UPI0027D29384|nr:DUF1622 domain-containing protein [Saccharothrix yanglingensis]